MRAIERGYAGLRLLCRLNADLILSTGLILLSLAGAAWLASLLPPRL